MNTIDLAIGVPDSLKKSDIVARELQILVDGLLSQTIDVPDSGQVDVIGLNVLGDSTITIELRGIYGSGAMSAPLVHEFLVSSGNPEPQSDIFDITVLRVDNEA